MTEPIKFPAQVARVQTLADGGLRVTLDLPEDTVVQAAALMECKRLGITGKVTWEPSRLESVTVRNNETQKGSEGSGPKMDRRRISIRRDKGTGA